MLRSLFKISYVSAGNILNALLGVAFLSAVAKTLSVEQFGKYALLTSLLVSVSKLIDFGTNSYYVSKSITSSQELKDNFLETKLYLFLISIPISIVILYVFKLHTWLIPFLIGLVGYGINITLFAFFQKIEQFHFAVALNSISAFIKGTFAVLIFMNILELTINSSFYIFSASMLGSVLLYFVLPKEYKHIRCPITLKHSKTLINSAMSAGLAQLISNGWPAITNSIAKIAKTYTDVGIFTLADKVANVFYLISISVFTVLLPKNSRRKKQKLEYDFKETLVIAVLILLSALLAAAISPLFIKSVFKEKYAASIGLLTALIFASGISAIHSFIDNFFFVEEKTKVILAVTLSKLAILLVSSTILIPLYSLKGLAWAQLISAVAALSLTFLFIIRAQNY